MRLGGASRGCVSGVRLGKGGAGGAVGEPVVLHPGDLPGGEAVHAAVDGVVHEVVHRVEARLGQAAVLGLVARAAGLGLRGGVVDQVARALAATFEGVEQAEPVPDLVHRGVTAVVAPEVSPGQAVLVDHHAVEGGRPARLVGRRGPAQDRARSRALRPGDVEVERVGPAPVQGAAHRHVVAAADHGGAPGGPARAVERREVEVEAGHAVGRGLGTGVGGVEDPQLEPHPLLGRPLRALAAQHVHVHRDAERRADPGRGGAALLGAAPQLAPQVTVDPAALGVGVAEPVVGTGRAGATRRRRTPDAGGSAGAAVTRGCGDRRDGRGEQGEPGRDRDGRPEAE